MSSWGSFPNKIWPGWSQSEESTHPKAMAAGIDYQPDSKAIRCQARIRWGKIQRSGYSHPIVYFEVQITDMHVTHNKKYPFKNKGGHCLKGRCQSNPKFESLLSLIYIFRLPKNSKWYGWQVKDKKIRNCNVRLPMGAWLKFYKCVSSSYNC
jgi:hypothetical protein